MTGSELIMALKDFSAMGKFVGGSGLIEAVSMLIGDIHMDAAKYALTAAGISNSPSARINSAITHLEAAHISFKKIYDQHYSYFGDSLKYDELISALMKDIWVSCLMAICYEYFRDYKQAKEVLRSVNKMYEIHKEIIQGNKDTKWYEDILQLPAAALGLMCPGRWIAAFEKVPVVTKEEFNEICICIDKL